MENITVRKLEKDDASQVAFLIWQLTKNIVEPEKLLQRIESLAEPGNWQCFVAEKDGKVVGYGQLAWYPIPSKGMMGWIEEIVVDEPFRGQRLGHQIMEELLIVACFRGLAQLKLTTKNSQHLYEGSGFSVNEQEHLMVKKYYEVS